MLITHLKSEKGMAMALTLVIGAVAILISSVFWHAGSSRTIHAARNANQIQAYYFARSGVEAALGLLYTKGFFPHKDFPIEFYGDLNNLKQGEPGDEDYSLKVKIFEVDEVVDGKRKKGLQIESEGRVEGTQGARSTADNLTYFLPGWTAVGGKPVDPSDPNNGDSYAFDYAVFTQDDITLDGSARIKGPVGTNSGYVELGNSTNCKITNAGEYPGILSLGPGAGVNKPNQTQGVNHFTPEKELPAVPDIPDLPTFPDYPDYPNYPGYPDLSSSVPEQLNINNNTTESLDPSKVNVYSKISFSWDKTLTFALNGDTTAVIQDINGSGNIKLSGQGNLFLVVDRNLDGFMDVNAGGDYNRLTVLYEGTSTNRRSDSNFFGSLYAPNATFKTNNASTMVGDLVIGGNSISIGSSNNLDGSVYAPNATFITNSNFTMTGDLNIGGRSISIGSSNDIKGSIYTPIADINTSNSTNILGDILTNGTSINFNGVSHHGNVYASNDNAIIKYNGGRSLVTGTITNIYSKGTKVEIETAHLQGNIHLSNQNAELKLAGNSTLIGNIYTKGKKVDAPGNIVYQGFIYAPNNNATISIQGSSSMPNVGGIIAAGKSVSFIGNASAFQGVVYAPNADVLVNGSSDIHGAVVSKTFDGGNGNRAAVSYIPISTENFPIPIVGGNGEPAEDPIQGDSRGGIWIQQ